MTPNTPPPGISDDGGNVERRLIQVSERLERASSDLQSLVDQLRASFQQSNEANEAQRQRDEDRSRNQDGTDDGTNGPTPEDPNTNPSA